MRIGILTCVVISGISGCCSEPTISSSTTQLSSPRSIVPYPSSRLPSEAPASAKQRCESLPPVAFSAGKVAISELISEIQKARHAYVDCANRHNVLVDYEGKLERGVIDIYNHYQKQIR